ncbi:hypothetical protein EAH89_30115 [Roseomonas nepalensis]|uniref:Tyr recombinase domain-containing protein n=1 Tax=Muricoccus nepalensis TaxID=1854500 RepID=A0A502EGU3_9PROT|nr:hypothetical protein EAH89_30115 [Roseomonas nepalensis]
MPSPGRPSRRAAPPVQQPTCRLQLAKFLQHLSGDGGRPLRLPSRLGLLDRPARRFPRVPPFSRRVPTARQGWLVLGHGFLGRLRLSDRNVARVVKACVGAAGYDPTAFAGHSLRSGFITTAAREGVAERHIQNQSRHKSLPVLRGYIRRGSLFVDNAAARVGL